MNQSTPSPDDQSKDRADDQLNDGSNHGPNHDQSPTNSNNTPSLDDAVLRKLEAQLSERLVARPSNIDREQLLFEMGWQASLASTAAAEASSPISPLPRETGNSPQQTASRSANSSSIPSRYAIAGWSAASGLMVAASIALVLLLSPWDKNSQEQNLPSSQHAAAPVDGELLPSSETPTNSEDVLATQLAETPHVKAQPIKNEPNNNDSNFFRFYNIARSKSSAPPEKGRVVLRGMSGIQTLESLNSWSKSRPLNKDISIEEYDAFNDSYDKNSSTAFEMMREWMLRTEKSKK